MSYSCEHARFIRSKYHPIVKLCPPEQHTSFIITIADICDPEKPESWKFGLSAALWGSSEQPSTNEERAKLFKSYAANCCEPLKSAALWLPGDTFILPDVFHVWTDPVKWDNRNGRTTIAGDAAHPISPFRGQGLNNALQDAALYVEAIGAVVSGVKSLEVAVSESQEDWVFNVQTHGTRWSRQCLHPALIKVSPEMIGKEIVDAYRSSGHLMRRATLVHDTKIYLLKIPITVRWRARASGSRPSPCILRRIARKEISPSFLGKASFWCQDPTKNQLC